MTTNPHSALESTVERRNLFENTFRELTAMHMNKESSLLLEKHEVYL